DTLAAGGRKWAARQRGPGAIEIGNILDADRETIGRLVIGADIDPPYRQLGGDRVGDYKIGERGGAGILGREAVADRLADQRLTSGRATLAKVKARCGGLEQLLVEVGQHNRRAAHRGASDLCIVANAIADIEGA